MTELKSSEGWAVFDEAGTMLDMPQYTRGDAISEFLRIRSHVNDWPWRKWRERRHLSVHPVRIIPVEEE
jgi:hypothetical protein